MERGVKLKYSNWDFLRFKILESHPGRRPIGEIVRSLDKEFRRLASVIKRNTLSPLSYKILVIAEVHPKSHCIIKARGGFTVRLDYSDIGLFESWVDLPASQKEVPQTKTLLIGGTAYTIIPEREIDTKTHRLNVLHGSE